MSWDLVMEKQKATLTDFHCCLDSAKDFQRVIPMEIQKDSQRDSRC